MTTIIDGTAGITFPSGSGTQAAQSKVLQVVNATYATYTTTTSTSIAATGLTANIAPLFTTSKILVMANMIGCGGSVTNNNPHFEVYRNGSSTSYFDDVAGYGGSNVGTSISYLDSPSSTSSQTYTIYWKRVGGGAGNVFINNYISSANQTVSTLTLMEIAG